MIKHFTFTTVEKYILDAWKLAAGLFGLVVILALYKQANPAPVMLSPLGTGEVTVIKVTETKVEKIKISEIIDKIWTLESSRGQAPAGLHVYCKNQGMSNEYGYGGMALKLCFRNHKEATAMIHLWFNQQLETKSVEQALCYYNTGRADNNCEYLKAYQLVKGK